MPEKPITAGLRNLTMVKLASKDPEFETKRYIEYLSKHTDEEAKALADTIKERGFLIDSDIEGVNEKHKKSYLKDTYVKEYTAGAAKAGALITAPLAGLGLASRLVAYNTLANSGSSPRTRLIMNAGAAGETAARFLPLVVGVSIPTAFTSSVIGDRKLHNAVTDDSSRYNTEKIARSESIRERFTDFSEEEFEKEKTRLQRKYIDKNKKVPKRVAAEFVQRKELLDKLRNDTLSEHDFAVNYHDVLESQKRSYLKTYHPKTEDLDLKLLQGAVGGALANYPRWKLTPGARSAKGLAASTAAFSAFGAAISPDIHNMYHYNKLHKHLVNPEIDIDLDRDASVDDMYSIYKEAGLKQIKRILEAELNTNPKMRRLISPRSGEIYKDTELKRSITEVDSLLMRSDDHKIYGVIKNRGAASTVQDYIKLDPRDRLEGIDATSAKISEALARHNKDVDIKVSGKHNLKASKPEEYLSSPYYTIPAEQATIGMRLYNKNQPGKHYYTSKDKSYLPSGHHQDALNTRKDVTSLFLVKEEPPIWVSKHPQVAASYIGEGEHIFKLRNTKSLVKGGAPRDHMHLSTDTRGIPEPLLSYQEFLQNNTFGLFGRTKATRDYERVLSYNPKKFDKNLDSVLVNSGKEKAIRTAEGEIEYLPALYEASKAEKPKALPKLFSEQQVSGHGSAVDKLRSKAKDFLDNRRNEFK